MGLYLTNNFSTDFYHTYFYNSLVFLSFMKRKLTTQIGSLPYESVKEAMEYSLRHDIPFLPELPKKGEFMFDYIKTPGKLSCLSDFKKSVRGYETVKVQCVGPATLMKYGNYNENEVVERANSHISEIMNGLDVKETILFLDEPALGVFELTEDKKRFYRDIWQEIFKKFNVVGGIHNCGERNLDYLLESDLKIVSFDASKYDITNQQGYKVYRTNGKRIAWGIESKRDIKDFREGDLITLPCSMAPPKYKIEDCDKELRKLESIACFVR